MPRSDKSDAELRACVPSLPEPPDLDRFRAQSLYAHMDQNCPPSTAYAAFNACVGPKEICDDEGGQIWQCIRQLNRLAARLQRSA
jgi:hypothetical protein